MRVAPRRVRPLIAAAAIVVVALVLTGCTPSAPDKTTWAEAQHGSLPAGEASQLTTAVSSAITLDGATGAVVGVWAPWAGSWTAGVGTTALRGNHPMTANDSFRIGSVTKTMSCEVLLGLVKAHKVRLADPVSKYLPQMVGIGGVTLQQLCQNTSGLSDYQNLLNSSFVSNPTRPWDQLELVENALGLTQTTPGRFNYSNGGFVLLGMALQQATGESWAQLYSSYVTGPLGAQDTTLPSDTSLPSPAPAGYADPVSTTGQLQCTGRTDVTQLSSSMGPTSVGVVSNLTDTASIVHAVADGQLVGGALAKTQQTGVAIGHGAPSWAKYGLGVELLGPLVGHAGSIPGFATAAYSDPASGFTVVVSLNNSNGGANVARMLALQLAAIAWHSPPAAGKKAPSAALPWNPGQAGTALKVVAPCQKHPTTTTSAAIEALAALQPSN